MRPSHRKIVLFAILAGLLALVIFDPAGAPESDATSSAALLRAESPVNVADATVAASTALKVNGMALPERPSLGESRASLFEARSWLPPPPPKITVAPAPPMAPPMPYKFAGKLLQNGQLQVFLTKGDATISITPGQLLDSVYRVETIDENKIILVHLPSGVTDTIPVNSSLSTAGVSVVERVVESPRVVQTGPGTITTASIVNPVPGDAAKSVLKSAQLTWEGPPQVKLGSQFSVALRVKSEQPVRASPMQFKFDPGLLETVAVKPGRFFDGGGRTFSYRVNQDGAIFIGASNQDSVPASDAELLVLTFRPLKPASTTELSITSLSLQGAAGRSVAFDQLATFKIAITR